MGMVAFFSQQMLHGQATLVDPVEIFEGSLSNPENDEISLHWDVTNLTNDTLDLRVFRNIIQAVDVLNLPYQEGEPGAYDRFCWGPICYPIGSVSSNSSDNLLVTIAPGAVDTSFVCDYYPAGVAGVMALEYCFTPVVDFDASVCHTVLFCLDAENCALGTNEEQSRVEWGNITPQPVRGLSSLSYTVKSGQSGVVKIFNSAGKEVWTKAVKESQGLIYINGDDFSEGLYFLSLAIDGVVDRTQKFVVHH